MTEPAFDCKRCGHCCSGAGGIVCDARDLARLAAHFAVSEGEFVRRFAEVVHGKPRLKIREDDYCVFYDAGIAGCGVHPARPDVCRAWPFFRGNLEDESSWRMIQDYCPGINPRVGHAGFVREGRAYLVEQGLRRADDDGAPTALTAPFGERSGA